MAKQAKPTLPSGLDRGDLTYEFTSSQTTAHLASELTSRDGIRPIAYNWDDQSEEVQGLITKVWKLEEITSGELEKLPYEEYSRYLFDPRRRFDKPEALDGIRLLEVCRPDWSVFGLQFCGSLLSEHGAEVIKVEDPAKGDAMRWSGPPPEEGGAMKAEGENWPPHGTSLAGFCENRNKYSITIDITTPEGQEMFKDLARNVDVVIENYDAGYLDSLGIGYRQLRKLNPRLVYCGITGFGQFGEEAERKGFETATQAMGTLSSFTGAIQYDADSAEEAQAGFTPTRVGWPIGAISGGLGGAIAICGALLYRERKSGKGQMIDVSSYGLMMRSSDCSFSWYSSTKEVRGPYGNWDMSLCP
ncbi:MAG: CoA transferase, partial [Dehalococcoidia bacterium]